MITLSVKIQSVLVQINAMRRQKRKGLLLLTANPDPMLT